MQAAEVFSFLFFWAMDLEAGLWYMVCQVEGLPAGVKKVCRFAYCGVSCFIMQILADLCKVQEVFPFLFSWAKDLEAGLLYMVGQVVGLPASAKKVCRLILY